MKQQTLALAAGFEKFGKQSRRAEFLAAMDRGGSVARTGEFD